MKPQHQIESCRGVWNLPGMGWNWLTRDAPFEDRSSFCSVLPWRVCSITLTTFVVVIVVYIVEYEPAFSYVWLCVLCVYMWVWVPCTHEKAWGGWLSPRHSPVRQAGLPAPESHLSQTACWGYKWISFLHGGGIWTQDDVLPIEPFILDV